MIEREGKGMKKKNSKTPILPPKKNKQPETNPQQRERGMSASKPEI